MVFQGLPRSFRGLHEVLLWSPSAVQKGSFRVPETSYRGLMSSQGYWALKRSCEFERSYWVRIMVLTGSHSQRVIKGSSRSLIGSWGYLYRLKEDSHDGAKGPSWGSGGLSYFFEALHGV